MAGIKPMPNRVLKVLSKVAASLGRIGRRMVNCDRPEILTVMCA